MSTIRLGSHPAVLLATTIGGDLFDGRADARGAFGLSFVPAESM